MPTGRRPRWPCLPPRRAFAEGGYEVDWAREAGLSASLEATVRARIVRAAGMAVVEEAA